MSNSLRGDFASDGGMVCLWDTKAFAHVVGYDQWDKELCEDEDIIRHITAGNFVPVNTNQGIDGCVGVHMRVGSGDHEEKLSERESKYLLAQSDAYLLKCKGRVGVCGLEAVEADSDDAEFLSIPEGEYAVQVALIGWDEEPGMRDEKGLPTANALPDFVVTINPRSASQQSFRTHLYALPDPE